MEEKKRYGDLRNAIRELARILDDTGGTVLDFMRVLPSIEQLKELLGIVIRTVDVHDVDEFGQDKAFIKAFEPLFDFFYYRYFRVVTLGIGNVPRQGAALLVANHSGTLPYDGLMVKLAVKTEHREKRDIRFLSEDFVYHFPFLGTFITRLGGVRACPENAERLLHRGEVVAVFPEGIKGIGKYYKQKYQVQRFGRGGVIRLAMSTKCPIVPVAIVGAEEIHPMIGKLTWLAKLLGLPFIPITPTFPLLGPFGLIPLPSKWYINFGKPILYDAYTDADLDDNILIGRLNEELRQSIQSMIRSSLKRRAGIIFD
jgi:1-acyl-sn-glycerol-3-phosphate acyltransferase